MERQKLGNKNTTMKPEQRIVKAIRNRNRTTTRGRWNRRRWSYWNNIVSKLLGFKGSDGIMVKRYTYLRLSHAFKTL